MTLVRGIAPSPGRGKTLRIVRLDPTTHAFVMATALITSIAFMISMLNVIAVVLSHILY